MSVARFPTLRWRVLVLAEEEDRRRRLAERRNRRRARALFRLYIDPFRDIPEVEFVKTFRLGKSALREIIDVMLPFMPKENRRDGIDAELKVIKEIVVIP